MAAKLNAWAIQATIMEIRVEKMQFVGLFASTNTGLDSAPQSGKNSFIFLQTELFCTGGGYAAVHWYVPVNSREELLDDPLSNQIEANDKAVP